METGQWLGRQVAAPEQYSPDALVAVARTTARENITVCWETGADEWTGWELSWLDAEGMPECAVLQLVVPADSPNIVESKSLKLYLNSLNFTRFPSREALCETLGADIEACVGTAVQVALQAPDNQVLMTRPNMPGDCLDVLLPRGIPAVVDVTLLRCDPACQQAISVHTRLFRSCCPVTGQPDWATVCIDYAGPALDLPSLLAYLLSYRRHHGFHEQCVERIFADIVSATQCEQLRVSARFLRRGGLEINPWRVRGEGFAALPGRELRQ